MIRPRLMFAFLAVATGSVGALAQTPRPQDPYLGSPYTGGYAAAASAADSVQRAPRARGVEPARYAADELSLESSEVVWVPPRPSAADASRAVAEQLRQQYAGAPAAGPQHPYAAMEPRQVRMTEPRPAYRPLPGPEFSYSAAAPPGNPYAMAEAAGSRQPFRAPEAYRQDLAPDFVPGQPQRALESWPTPAVPGQPQQPQVPGAFPGSGGSVRDRGPGAAFAEDVYGHSHGPNGLGSNGYGANGFAGAGSGYGYGAGGSGAFAGSLPMASSGCGTCDDCYAGGTCQTADCGDGGWRFARGWNRGCRDMYTIVGARWLFLRRDGADYKSLSYEWAMPSTTLLVEDANSGPQSGVEVFFIRQDQNGRGWEGRYWGLPSQSASATLGNVPFTQLTSLSQIDIGTWGSVAGLYNTADYHQVTRSSELHSFELNLINHASTCGTGRWLYRGLMGARVIRFRDRLDYSAYSATNFGYTFDQVNYGLLTRNTFVGAQAGGSGEYCVTNKLRLAIGANAGIGQVFIDADQVIETSTGVQAFHPGGGSFSYMNSADDLAVFGEFDLRAYYHFSQNWRLSCGYRLLGISGFALAQHQIPYAFNRVDELNAVKRDGGLILHGLTLGAEFSY